MKNVVAQSQHQGPLPNFAHEDLLPEQLSAAHLVWSHLTHHCHDGAAMAFLRQWQGDQFSSCPLLQSAPWLTMEHRKCTLRKVDMFPARLCVA